MRVELLALAGRVEDPKVGLRVGAGAGGPLPAAVVGGVEHAQRIEHKSDPRGAGARRGQHCVV
jgi:hypothetical protein